MDKSRPTSSLDEPRTSLAPGWKALISVLVALHVAAIFIGPWSIRPHGSEFARTLAYYMSPYLEAAFLDNGYRFFAPEPDAGHLVRYEVTTRDGRHIEGSFPDRQAQWPRLLYHRYFMLSEFLNTLGAPEGAELQAAYGESYGGHLVDKYDAQSLKLYLRQHRLPTMADIRGGKKLSDPEFYEEKLIVDYDRDEP